MQQVPWTKVINLGEFMDQLQSGGRPSKGVQALETALERGIQADKIPAFNQDGPGSRALHAVREGGDMAVAGPVDINGGASRMPRGFFREAHVPVGYVIQAAADAGLGQNRHIAQALQSAPDHAANLGRLQPINGAGKLPRVPEALAGEAVDAAPSGIPINPPAARSRPVAGGAR